MTTYEAFAAGRTNIVFAKDRTLVLGFMVESYDPAFGTPFEVIYAVHPDGRVLGTNPIAKPNHDFDRKGRVWHEEPEGVPPHAEFIGNYEPTMFKAVA